MGTLATSIDTPGWIWGKKGTRTEPKPKLKAGSEIIMRTRNRLLSSTLATLLTLVGLAPANAFAGSITASCPSMNEGNAGTTSFTCTITIDCDPAAFATIGWAFADGSATTADSDYSASSGSLGQQCNAVGVTMHNVSVDVTGAFSARG